MNEVSKMALNEVSEQLEMSTSAGYQVNQCVSNKNYYDNTARGLNVLFNSLTGEGELTLTEDKRKSLVVMLEEMLAEQQNKRREDNMAKENLDKMLNHNRKANQWILAIKSDNGK